MSEEVWRDIKGYEGIYQVSNLGRVKSFDSRDKLGRVRKGKILKPMLDIGGYEKVTLYNKQPKIFSVHYLVISSFVGARPKNMVINHIDENKRNNNLNNLEYVSQKDNINHGSGNIRRMKNQPHSVKLIAKSNNNVFEFNSICECARELKLNIGHISECLNGNRKSHGGYTFEKI